MTRRVQTPVAEPMPTLLDLHPCPTCDGSGRRHDPETGDEARCRVCEGAGTVQYDPDDVSEIPFG